jgi:hypothetical protein
MNPADLFALVPQPLSALESASAILAAVASNTVRKIAIGAAIGRGRFALELALMAACASRSVPRYSPSACGSFQRREFARTVDGLAFGAAEAI